jgi:hypothetical protein
VSTCRGAGEDTADGAGADPVTEADKFALYPAMPPARVLPGQPDHQVTHLVADPRAAVPVRIGPVPTAQPPMPGQQGGRGDDPMLPQRAG